MVLTSFVERAESSRGRETKRDPSSTPLPSVFFRSRLIMSPITISLLVLACIFGGALLGILLHSILPEHHLSADSKDIVKLGVGLVGTMAALVLGLLVAAAKGAYDAQSGADTDIRQHRRARPRPR
jgi:uncharacterized membrane protein YqhA